MRSRLLKMVLTSCTLWMGYNVPAQRFYVSVPINVPVGAKVFKLNVSSCDSEAQQFCRPTVNISQYPENQYIDMAVDVYGNAWYVTGGGNLYQGRLNDSSNCMYLGNIIPAGLSGGVNSLAVDSLGFIYAAGWMNGAARLILFKPATGARELGSFPPDIVSNGDLFFYEHRLFLTSGDIGKPKSLVEVSLPDPAKSCIYMPLGADEPYGAFSIRNGSTSRAFLVSVNKQMQSVLTEIDIPGKKLLSPLCTYPFAVTGAGAPYGLTADSTTCTSGTLAVNGPAEAANYFSVINPAVNTLQIRTNLPGEAIASLRLYDISGRQVKDFRASGVTGPMDISELSSGMYMLFLRTAAGDCLVQRVVKQ